MHQYLLSNRRTDVTCTLTDDALVRGEAPYQQIPYAEIRHIRFYGSPGWTSYGQEVTPSASVCDIIPRRGKRLSLVSKRSGCDRTLEHKAFVSELLKRVAPYSNVVIYTGMSWPLWLFWAFVFLVMAIGFAFSGFGTIFLITSLFSDVHSTPMAGVLAFAGFMLFTGLGTIAVWRILRIERPRRQTGVR